MQNAYRALGFGATALWSGLGASLALAQDAYPAKLIRFVAPFPPGGTTGVLSRILAQKLTDSLGRQVVVDNRAGAGGNIGHEIAAKTAPGGYTLLIPEAWPVHAGWPLTYHPVPDIARAQGGAPRA